MSETNQVRRKMNWRWLGIFFRRQPRSTTNPAADEPFIGGPKENLSGWILEIVGDYGLDDNVPPQAIRGAWKVSKNGKMTGEFMSNPKFEPSFHKPKT